MWTQLRMDYLKGGVMAAQISLASGIAALANGVTRFSQWAEEKSRRVEFSMSQGSSRCWNGDLEDSYEEKKC